MLLSRLLSVLPACAVYGETELEITRLVSISSLADERCIFADLSEDDAAGRAHCFDASRHGCRVFLRRGKCKKTEIIKEQTLILSENPVKIVSEASYLLAGHPERSIRLLGITGTKGKSTVCATVCHLLSSCGIPCLSVGTLGVGGVSYPPFCNTTPDAPILADILSRAVKAGIRYGVIEISSQALARGRVRGLSFPVCVFTSFSSDHIGEGEHSSLQAYFSAKRSLFTDYGCETAVINRDDAMSISMTAGVRNILSCGKAKATDYHLQKIFSDGFSYNERRVYFPLPGEFFAMDALLALAAASALTGLPASRFEPSLPTVSIPGRYEKYSVAGKRCIVDFAHNGASFDAVLSEERRHTAGKILCVFGSVGDRTGSRRRDLALSACRLADFSVITSDDPGYEDPLGICAEIYAAFPDKTKARIVVDREAAIRYAFSLLREGDSLLLLGKGQEEIQKVKGNNLPFSEKKILRSLDTTALL